MPNNIQSANRIQLATASNTEHGTIGYGDAECSLTQGNQLRRTYNKQMSWYLQDSTNCVMLYYSNALHDLDGD